MGLVTHLVTGDAVTLDMRVAGLPSRALALIVDLIVQVSLLSLSLVLLAWVYPANASGGFAFASTLAVTVGMLVGWPTMLETLSRGRSLGKALMGLRVVREDGGPIRMRHALVRALAMVFLDLWTTSGVVGGLSSLLSRNSKRMGDHLAGTMVIGERLPASAAAGIQPILMPPQLAAWAANLDLVAVPDQLALAIRTFLHRAPAMDPRARYETGTRMATQLAAIVGQPAPLGTPAEAYLAAVVAERSRRATPGAAQGTPDKYGGTPGATPYGTSGRGRPVGSYGLSGTGVPGGHGVSSPSMLPTTPPQGQTSAQEPPSTPDHPQPPAQRGPSGPGFAPPA